MDRSSVDYRHDYRKSHRKRSFYHPYYDGPSSSDKSSQHRGQADPHYSNYYPPEEHHSTPIRSADFEETPFSTYTDRYRPSSSSYRMRPYDNDLYRCTETQTYDETNYRQERYEPPLQHRSSSSNYQLDPSNRNSSSIPIASSSIYEKNSHVKEMDYRHRRSPSRSAKHWNSSRPSRRYSSRR